LPHPACVFCSIMGTRSIRELPRILPSSPVPPRAPAWKKSGVRCTTTFDHAGSHDDGTPAPCQHDDCPCCPPVHHAAAGILPAEIIHAAYTPLLAKTLAPPPALLGSFTRPTDRRRPCGWPAAVSFFQIEDSSCLKRLLWPVLAHSPWRPLLLDLPSRPSPHRHHRRQLRSSPEPASMLAARSVTPGDKTPSAGLGLNRFDWTAPSAAVPVVAKY
jgi:hypothetical protein